MTPPEFTIRPARMQDLPQLAALCAELGYPSSMEQVQARLEEIGRTGRQAVFVAELAGGVVAGWAHALRCVYLETDVFVELAGLVVAAGQRGRGLGQALLAAVEAWAVNEGVEVVRLRSNTIRTEAHAFYHRAGYDAIKTQTAFVKKVA